MIVLPRLRHALVAGMLAGLALTAPAPAAQADAANQGEDPAVRAAQFLETLGERAIARLSDEGETEQARHKAFRMLLRDGFAMTSISRFVLGRYWRVASAEEQERFQDTFERVLAQRFLPLFAGYDQDDFIVEGAKPDPAQPKLYAVHTRITQPDRAEAEKVRVVWRVRPSDGSFEIVDVKVENISMAITLRSEYNSAIQRAGGDVSRLIEMLQKKLAEGAYAPQTAGSE